MMHYTIDLSEIISMLINEAVEIKGELANE